MAAEQLFKQGAWGSSIFLIECSPSPGTREEGKAARGRCGAEATPRPKGMS